MQKIISRPTFANLRVFAAQFAVARASYRVLVRTRSFLANLANKILRVDLVATPRYRDDIFFPVTENSLPFVAKKLLDEKYVFDRYGHAGLEALNDAKNFGGVWQSQTLDPNPYFDTDWYVGIQRQSGIGLDLPPLVHYLKHSRTLGLSPSPSFLHTSYLQLNPDLKKSKMNILYHYIVYGKSEQRSTSEIDELNARRRPRATEGSFIGSEIAVLIPVFNNWLWTERALESVVKETKNLNVSIYVADDCSTDVTPTLLRERFPEVRIIENSENQGFLKSCNRAFQIIAKTEAKYVFLLNNDAEVQPGFLDEPMRVMAEDSLVGLVGSKLIYPDGSLQEAGSIVWRDATAWNYGKGAAITEAKFDVAREVDYASGAALLLRISAITDMSFFDEMYLPAYYEDTDLAFTLRSRGWKTVFCPDSLVIHHEGKSHGTSTSSGIKKHQISNRVQFQEKWRAELDSHFKNDPLGLLDNAAFRIELKRRSRTILWLDYQLPDPSKDSGSVRAVELMKIARGLGYFVVFVPANGDARILDPFWLRRHGVVVTPNVRTAKSFLKRLNREPDIIWFSRVNVCEDFFEPLTKAFPNAKTVFDTVDLHHLRLFREAKSKQSRVLEKVALKVQKSELRYVHRSDLTIVVSDFELEMLSREFAAKNVSRVSNVHLKPTQSGETKVRRGLIFVGSFNHSPNESGVLWFVENVWPLLSREVQEEGLRIVGPNPSPKIVALADRNIQVLGWVPSSIDLVREAKVSVAPLIAGAGVKGKIGEAMVAGTPVVTTSIGSEGMRIRHLEHAMVADSEREFADAIEHLYRDDRFADLLALQAANLIESEFGHELAVQSMTASLEKALFSKKNLI